MQQRKSSSTLQHIRHRRLVATQRRGVATLEFGLTLPVVLFTMVCLIWFGTAMYKLNEVTIRARNNAWKKRYNNPQGQPFRFDVEGQVDGKSSQRVGVSPLFESLAPASSKHVVMAGSWDHRQLKQYQFGEQHPNWQLVGVIGKGQVRDALNLRRNIQNLVRFDGAAFQQMFAGKLSQLLSLGQSADQNIKAGQARDKAKREREKQKVQQNVRENEGKLEQVNNAIQNLQTQSQKLKTELDKDARKPKSDKTKLTPKQRKMKEDRRAAINREVGRKQREKRKIQAELTAGKRYLQEAQ